MTAARTSNATLGRRSIILVSLAFLQAAVVGLVLVPHPSFAADSLQFAGLRVSRILNSYPNRQFPSASYWINATKAMARKFPGSRPTAIWIVSLYQSSGITRLDFPSEGRTIPFVQFNSTDLHESYLSALDTAGVSVWLQVEPGAAALDTLIPIVLNRYKHHSCVMGFGVDVEWYFANLASNGLKVTDSAARVWEQRVTSVDPSYSLFLKHFSISWMPPSYRGNILFVDDSQEFSSLSSMVNEFKGWGSAFSSSKVAFQVGYPIDTTWWKSYADPPLSIGNALKQAVPNCSGIFWVDFTVTRIFPVTGVPEQRSPDVFSLEQNFPNPFNPSTQIQILNSKFQIIKLSVFDLPGREVAVLVNEEKPAGAFTVTWNAARQPSGVYYFRLTAGDVVLTRRALLLK